MNRSLSDDDHNITKLKTFKKQYCKDSLNDVFVFVRETKQLIKKMKLYWFIDYWSLQHRLTQIKTQWQHTKGIKSNSNKDLNHLNKNLINPSQLKGVQVISLSCPSQISKSFSLVQSESFKKKFMLSRESSKNKSESSLRS